MFIELDISSNGTFVKIVRRELDLLVNGQLQHLKFKIPRNSERESKNQNMTFLEFDNCHRTTLLRKLYADCSKANAFK